MCFLNLYVQQFRPNQLKFWFNEGFQYNASTKQSCYNRYLHDVTSTLTLEIIMPGNATAKSNCINQFSMKACRGQNVVHQVQCVSVQSVNVFHWSSGALNFLVSPQSRGTSVKRVDCWCSRQWYTSHVCVCVRCSGRLLPQWPRRFMY